MVKDLAAALVVIDPLMAFLSGAIDAHRDQDVRRALASMAYMAARTGAAVLIVRHMNKSGGTNPLYRGGAASGSSAPLGRGCWPPPTLTTTPAASWR